MKHPHGILVVDGGTLPEHTIQNLVMFMERVGTDEEPNLYLLEIEPDELGNKPTIDFYSLASGTKTKMQEADNHFIEKAIKEGRIKFTTTKHDKSWPTYHTILDTICNKFNIPGSPDLAGALNWISERYRP